MSNYRRSRQTGTTFFFTVVTYHRRPILCDEPVRIVLREAIQLVRATRSFAIDGWVLLPDHLHCIWTLPPGDADFSRRWGSNKRLVSLKCGVTYHNSALLNDSKKKHRGSTIWQRRFWEHEIRNGEDFRRHLDYLHYNPVKHGLCERPRQWPYSSLHRYVAEGRYPADWAVASLGVENEAFGE